MLAVASSAGITLLPTSLAKNLPSHVALSIETQSGAVAAAWSPDHTFLLFAQGRAIHRATANLSLASELIHEDEGEDVVSHIVCPTPSTAIYSAGRRITLITHTPFRVNFSIDGKHIITSLSLSLDASTLFYTTSASAHTLSLATKASVTLRGLALSDGAQILGCAVHPHTRGRAILAAGRSLLVYDVNRPSAPLKIIGAGGSEPLVFVTCSPFSRTLVAAGTSSGNVALIDLEKDKSMVRTVPLGTSLSALVFSDDGASLYAGTLDGRLLVQKLRDLASPPQEAVLDPAGKPVIGLWPQRKPRSTPESSAGSLRNLPASSSHNPLASPPPAIQTMDSRTSTSSFASQDRLSPALRTRRISSAPVASKPTPSRTPTSRQASDTRSTALTPSRDPLRNARPKLKPASPALKAPPLPRVSRLSAAEASDKPRRRVESSASQAPRRTLKPKPTTVIITQPPPSKSSPIRDELQVQSRPKTPTSRSSSPELPTVKENPVTPLPRRAASHRPQSSSPTEDAQATRGRPGKERAVAFVSDSDDGDLEDADVPRAPRIEELDEDEARREPIEAPLRGLQVSPAKSRDTLPVPSPLRNAGLGIPPGGNPNGNAQELLRSLFADALTDALTDVRAETARGIQGLHLDLIRAGRSWRSELKDSLGGVQNELQELREENARLREENERLRKGY